MYKPESYLYPKTSEEALQMLASYDGKAMIMSGGTDLVLWMKHGKKTPVALVDIDAIEELKGIELKDGNLVIGAGMTHADVAENELVNSLFPNLAKGCGSAGAPQTRNIGTVGGNIVSAQPAADSSVNFVALGASCEILSASGRRIVPVESLFLGVGRSAVDPGKEIMTKIIIPVPTEKYAVAYQRVAPRASLALPIANVSVMLIADGAKIKDARIVASPVATVPYRAKKTEEALKGMALTDPSLAATVNDVIQTEINPRDSKLRGSADYRKALIGVLTERAVSEAINRILSK